MSNNDTKDTYCSLAWVHSFVNLGGEYQVCCTSEEFDNYIRFNNSKELMTIKSGLKIDQVMNSDTMKQLRSLMLNNKWHPMCTRCKTTEQLGGVSRRNIENGIYEKFKEHILANTKEDGEINKVEIHSMDYRLGNHCNLECRSCNPKATKKWIQNWNEIQPKPMHYSDEWLNEFMKYDWYNDDKLIADVISKSDKVTHLHFAGGEPLIVPKMREILEVFINNNRAKEIVLTYNTNITNLPPKVLELWKFFKEIRLLVSIDGYGELNDYMRPPSKWAIVDKNLTYLDDHFSEFKITQIMLNTTVQINNVTRLGEICNYLQKFKNVVPVPNFIALYFPLYFKITALPQNIKELAKKELLTIIDTYSDKLPVYEQYLIQNIHQIINFMSSAEEQLILKEYYDVTSKLDKHHDVKLRDVLPEIANIFHKA